MQNSETRLKKPRKSVSKTVAIIGAGLIGCGWAIVFARAGWRVNLYDLHQHALVAAQDTIAAQLNLLEAHHLCSETSEIQSHIHCVTKLQAAVQGADYIQECGPENLDEKCKIFRELDEITPPEAILASSSSGLMTSQFTCRSFRTTSSFGCASGKSTPSGAACRNFFCRMERSEYY